MQQIGLFIAKHTVRSTCFGHHYAHHQELNSYTNGSCLWYLALWLKVVGLVWRCGLRVRFAGCCNIPHTGHINYSSTPDQRALNQSAKYHKQQHFV